ncbi:MAG TPA: alcohol dehydrogenase catalytic domain-containing protein, partial [Chloroflexota bacterium]|nr:alcohol dehydrogenase catalytic domain-containing protein [Chloroflexota bacterium]
MKALRFHARGVATVDDVDEPKLVDGWTIVAPTFTGICGTDVKQYRYGPFGISQEPHPLSRAQLPLTLGHEIGGVIVETSSSDPRLVAGARVAVDSAVKCGACWYCQHGHYILCERGAILGISAHGGLAELVAVPNYALHPVPDELTDEEVALAEPVSVAIHAVRRLRLQAGDSVCIVGGGVIGLSIMQAARACGARSVGVVEPIPERRSLALELGADFAVAPPAPDDDPDAQAAINAR